MYQQLAMQMVGLPLNLILISNGQLAVCPRGIFNTIYDQPEQGISAVISSDKMLVGNTEVSYNKALSYKQMPELLEWLVQQKLEQPY